MVGAIALKCLPFDGKFQRYFDVHIRSKQDWKNFQVEEELKIEKWIWKKKCWKSRLTFFQPEFLSGFEPLTSFHAGADEVI